MSDADWKPGIGYRYLRLSRRLNVDYGDVLSFVDLVENWAMPATYWQRQARSVLSPLQQAAIRREIRAEHQRREKLCKQPLT